jgi:hypothetical protein
MPLYINAGSNATITLGGVVTWVPGRPYRYRYVGTGVDFKDGRLLAIDGTTDDAIFQADISLNRYNQSSMF